jgi:hypothetical protein
MQEWSKDVFVRTMTLKAQAVLEGVRLGDVIERGLLLVLAEPAQPTLRRCTFQYTAAGDRERSRWRTCTAQRSRYNVTRTLAVPMLYDVNVLLVLARQDASRWSHSLLHGLNWSPVAAQ